MKNKKKQLNRIFYMHCGNYRMFEVNAENEKQARERFKEVQPAGFTENDITAISKKQGGNCDRIKHRIK